MTKRTPNFARVLPPTAEPLRAEEIDAIIELAFLMANADGQASFDELDSFRALVKHFRPSAEMTPLLDDLSAKLDAADSLSDRARKVSATLARPASRDAAYKAVYTIAVFDLETNEEERDLDDLLVETLSLGDRVDDLEREVNEALST
jgi:hypothetical protein